MIVLKNILVATDFSDASAAALLYGKNFARQHAGALHVLHVADDVTSHIEPLTGPIPDVGRMQKEIEDSARRDLDALITDEDRRVLGARTVVLRSASPAYAILAYAKEANIDLIIVGTHGRSGLAHFFMGSVAQHVVRAAPCPVLTVRQPERDFAIPDALQTVTPAPLH